MKNILLINDFAGVGKIAMSSMIPTLSKLGISSSYLPTALVSNTLSYGEFEILDTTSYMKNTIKCWDKLGFNFDAIATGFILTEEQANIIFEYCKKVKDNKTLIFVDPIFADHGKLYNSMNTKNINNMLKLIPISDYLIPNYTEACFLTNTEYKESISFEEVKELIEKLINLGAKSIVLTSCVINNKYNTVVYDGISKKLKTITYDYIPVKMAGTGDIFSAILISNILNDKDIFISTIKAMEKVYKLVFLNKDNRDLALGINVEEYSDIFYK